VACKGHATDCVKTKTEKIYSVNITHGQTDTLFAARLPPPPPFPSSLSLSFDVAEVRSYFARTNSDCARETDAGCMAYVTSRPEISRTAERDLGHVTLRLPLYAHALCAAG
jgi:hypothetical protein